MLEAKAATPGSLRPGCWGYGEKEPRSPAGLTWGWETHGGATVLVSQEQQELQDQGLSV